MRNIVNILGIALFAAIAAGTSLGQQALVPVPAVDLDRYSGRWYEIAKYPNKFQKKCVANTTATYTRKPNGKIEVVNECLKSDGTINRAKGEAKVADKASNAKLKVRFAPGFLSFLPYVWGDYWIIDLGPDYQYSIVGEPEREYLWILSRGPEMPEAQYQAIIKKVEEMGFVPSRLQRTPQNQSARPSAAAAD